jgi:hypothetical protein
MTSGPGKSWCPCRNSDSNGRRVPVRLVTMTVGKANPPDAIKNQRTRLRPKSGEYDRKGRSSSLRISASQAPSRGQRQITHAEALGISAEQYVQLKHLELETRVWSEGKCKFIENGAAVRTLSVK